MFEQLEPVKNGQYLREKWQESKQTTKTRWRLVLALFAGLWLAGAWYAPAAVSGIAQLDGVVRWLARMSTGGFSFIWAALKVAGHIEETTWAPSLVWLLFCLTPPVSLVVFIALMDLPLNQSLAAKRKQSKYAQSQGRLEPAAAAGKLRLSRGVPFVTVPSAKREQVKVGLDYESGEGHVMVIGPTRCGKGLNLTQTLLTWPGPALVIDPKGEQTRRTAAWRSQFGPIYCLPGHRIRLADYYHRLLDRDDISELHAHLMRPWESRETIFAQKTISLFTAAGLFAGARGVDPIRVLMDIAESDLSESLSALETDPAARRHVRVFTNGASPTECREDRFVTSAFGNFTTRLATYQKHIDTIAPPDNRLVIDPNWVHQNATIYLTYSLQDLQGVGGVVAAIIAAMLRHQMGGNRSQRLLIAIDELPAVGLRNVASYLATTGGSGITMLLYAQSIAQLKELYGAEGTQAILSNCAHQLWYRAAEYETAELMSRLYGTMLQVNPVHSASQGARQHVDSAGHSQRQINNNQGSSWSWQERPALTPSQVMALSREQVLVSTLSDERYVFLGQRLNPVTLFGRLPPPARLRLPTPIYHERTYTSWQMDVSTQDEQIEEAGRHSESPSPAAVENDRDADASDSSKSRPGNAEGSVGDVI